MSAYAGHRSITSLEARVSLEGWARFNLRQDRTHFLVLSRPFQSVMNEPVASWMESDDRIDVIGAVIGPSVNVMAFEVRAAIASVKRSFFGTALAAMPSALQHMRRNRSCSLVCVSCAGSYIGIGASSIDCALTNGCIVFVQKFIDLILKLLLLKRVSTHQDENDVGALPLFEVHLDLLMSVVNPLSIETNPVVVPDEEEERTPVKRMIAQLSIIIAVPWIVVVLSCLAVILIRPIRQVAVIVTPFPGIRDGDDRLFELAVLNPLLGIAAKYLFHFRAALKYATDVILPRHCNRAPICSPVVPLNVFGHVNGEIIGGQK